MAFRATIMVTGFLAAFGACHHAAASQQSGDVLSGRVLVQFREGVQPQTGAAKTGLAGFDRVAERFGVYSVERAFPSIEGAATKREISKKAHALRRVYKVRFSAPHHPDVAVEEFSRISDVEHAEPHVLYSLTWRRPGTGGAPLIPNDTEFRNQTHFDKLRMTEAWDVARAEDGDVVIAVVDGGTEWDHPDLRGNVWTNPGETPNNGVDDDSNGYIDDIRGWNFANDSADPRGLPLTPSNASHGTIVAGVAAAVTNNALGIAGTSWNTKFMPINVGCAQGDQLCYGLEGVVYAAMNGADIITASWGSSNASLLLQQAVEMALDEGALVVAGSGNEGKNVDVDPRYPSDFAATLSVGGTRKNSDENVYNYGRGVNVFAPSVDINGTELNGTYGASSGTSFAVPLVAGIAALVKTAFPDFDPRRVREQVRLTADAMEDANPQNLAGLLGRGRVNAYRAVTESTPPGVRLEDWTWTDEDANSDLRSSEVVQVTATFTNYSGEAQNLTVGLESASPFVTLTRASEYVGTLPYGASHTASFEFVLADNTPNRYLALLYTRITDDAIADGPDILRFSVNEGAATHSTGALIASITDEGNIGYLLFQGASKGQGFRVQNREGQQRDLLFEGGLLLGTGPESVSDCVRGTGVVTEQHMDLVSKSGSSLLVTEPGELTSQQGHVELVDSAAANPLGVSILQESYMDSSPENEDFLILKYTVTNLNEAASLSSLFVGLFFDWDVHEQDQLGDIARFDDDRMVGYVQDGSNPTAVAGVKVLTNNAGISYEAIHNPSVTYGYSLDDGFTEEEKWSFLSGGIGTTALAATDVAQIVGAGPFSLLPQQTAIVAFAVIGGFSEADFLQNTDNAQLLWDQVLNTERTSAEAGPGAPEGFTFAPIFPNPAASPQTLEFKIPSASDVRLVIYDMLGREVETLISGQKHAGKHHIMWNGNDAAERRVASGVYVARLSVRGRHRAFSASQPVVVLR